MTLPFSLSTPTLSHFFQFISTPFGVTSHLKGSSRCTAHTIVTSLRRPNGWVTMQLFLKAGNSMKGATVAIVISIVIFALFAPDVDAQTRSFSFTCTGDIKGVDVGGSNRTGQGYLQVHLDNQSPRQNGDYSFEGNELRVETQVGRFYWDTSTQRGEVRWGRHSGTCRR